MHPVRPAGDVVADELRPVVTDALNSAVPWLAREIASAAREELVPAILNDQDLQRNIGVGMADELNTQLRPYVLIVTGSFIVIGVSAAVWALSCALKRRR